MPLYEYECRNGHVAELLRTAAQMDEPTFCPECGDTAKRILSRIAYPGFVQTGSARESGRTPIFHPGTIKGPR